MTTDTHITYTRITLNGVEYSLVPLPTTKYPHGGILFESIGEHRTPKVGEWFLRIGTQTPELASVGIHYPSRTILRPKEIIRNENV